jgi:hypothetical protein
VVGAEEWHRLGGGVVLDGQLWEVVELRHVSIIALENGVALTFKVKAPDSPQFVGWADKEVVDEAAAALSLVTELDEELTLEVESEAPLIKVLNVRTDEVRIDDVGEDEVDAIDSVHVSSAGLVELVEFGTTEVVKADEDVDVSSDELADEEAPALIPKLRAEEKEDEFDKLEEVVLTGLASVVTLLEAGLVYARMIEIVEVDVVVVGITVVDVDADELDEESCDEEAAADTEPRGEGD